MVATIKKDPKVDDKTVGEAQADVDAQVDEPQADDAQADSPADVDGDPPPDEDADPPIAEDEEEASTGLLKRKRPTAARAKRSWRKYLHWQYVRRAVLPVLLIASLSVSGFLGWKLWQEHEVKLAGEQAQQAAIAYAQVLTSIDSNKVDENFRQVLDGATGEFKDMYTQSSVQLRQLLIDNKASAHGVVVDSAIQSASTNKVVVLVFIDQTVANSTAPDPRIDRSRIKMTMEKVDGRWRASKVQLL